MRPAPSTRLASLLDPADRLAGHIAGSLARPRSTRAIDGAPGDPRMHRDYCGDWHHRGSVERDLLGIAAVVAQHRERPLPDPQAIDRTAGLDDLAGGFEPRGEWEWRLDLIGAADHKAVGEVDAGGVDPKAHLVPLEVRAL